MANPGHDNEGSEAFNSIVDYRNIYLLTLNGVEECQPFNSILDYPAVTNMPFAFILYAVFQFYSRLSRRVSQEQRYESLRLSIL